MRMNLSSDDNEAYLMGSAIKAICIAEGGWMDWGRDGKVRFLNRGPNGEVGVYFPDWVIIGMKANIGKIKRYVEICRELEKEEKDFQKYGGVNKSSATTSGCRTILRSFPPG